MKCEPQSCIKRHGYSIPCSIHRQGTIDILIPPRILGKHGKSKGGYDEQ